MPFKRGTAFSFNALDAHRGSGIPKASPTGVSHPRLMAFFAIELTQGPNLRCPNLHVTQSIKRPQLGRLVAGLPRQCHVRGQPGVGARLWPSASAAIGRVCAPHTKMVCVPCQEGEEPEGGEEEGGGEDPNGVSIEQCAQCLLPVGTTTGHFLSTGWRGGREVVAPLTTEEVEGVAGRPDQCPLAKVCNGEALPWPTLQEHVGIKVPAGTILLVRKRMYGGLARVPPEREGVCLGGGVEASSGVCSRHGLRVAAEDELLYHVLIYGLAFLVVCVCVRMCGVHACVFVVEHFLLLSLQARRGSHVESNSPIPGNDPASSDVSVRFCSICQG